MKDNVAYFFDAPSIDLPFAPPPKKMRSISEFSNVCPILPEKKEPAGWGGRVSFRYFALRPMYDKYSSLWSLQLLFLSAILFLAICHQDTQLIPTASQQTQWSTTCTFRFFLPFCPCSALFVHGNKLPPQPLAPFTPEMHLHPLSWKRNGQNWAIGQLTSGAHPVMT